MAQLTHGDVSKIIDLAKSHAKIVCDNLYNKTAEEVGGNEYFKSILDRSFDLICNAEIESIRDYFNMYFSKTHNLSAMQILDLINTREYIQE